MIPLMGLLLSIYLAFKGVEIFQIAYSNKNAPGSAIAIGVASLIISWVIAAIFAFLFISSSTSLPTTPVLP